MTLTVGKQQEDDVSWSVITYLKLEVTGWPRTLENRENGEKKIPAGKNQGIWNFAENQGKIGEFQKILSL